MSSANAPPNTTEDVTPSSVAFTVPLTLATDPDKLPTNATLISLVFY